MRIAIGIALYLFLLAVAASDSPMATVAFLIVAMGYFAYIAIGTTRLRPQPARKPARKRRAA